MNKSSKIVAFLQGLRGLIFEYLHDTLISHLSFFFNVSIFCFRLSGGIYIYAWRSFHFKEKRKTINLLKFLDFSFLFGDSCTQALSGCIAFWISLLNLLVFVFLTLSAQLVPSLFCCWLLLVFIVSNLFQCILLQVHTLQI